MRRILIRVTALLTFLALSLVTVPDAAAATVLPPGIAPVAGSIVRGFDPPAERWGAGHRGIDLAADAGTTVVAAATGTVRFAGTVAGKGVVSIDHGGVVTTYEPVRALVQAGDHVLVGDPIGILLAGHDCPAAVCLHWGLKEGETYLDPELLLGGGEVRLISAAAFDDLARRQAEWEEEQRELAARGFYPPVDGVVTSPFGYRVNPISGLAELHDGIDFGAACGTPVRAAASGVITFQGVYGGFGNRITVDHGVVAGVALVTGYNHLQGFALAAGAAVTRGEIIGYVGTTGYSTGCHLHFQRYADGVATDPAPYLSG
ncbi:MAG: peptidoglycan DD-metalloendopeptidase family protein [Propionibacteriaceae bacterium]|jgi:murein DD-endopeptidase MepM/ murein hydrolase activator NlpD|nr:peptidoglycan DD-metalloendopeptidase family protein [Propionibacteriaceae bacterium]